MAEKLEQEQEPTEEVFRLYCRSAVITYRNLNCHYYILRVNGES
ncbi:hypothetical protein SAMN04490185_3178 [Pseudomonas frederiksbergensis]|uniref:Uncharacterized protein n=1 Tax=Pseudomonas frederiksbergensis TaxID=104087 RepID=A0A1H4ZG06_9PSED|nr:hypothetical protein [Pseudomonas frederiksbergensis]SED28558.1 hypothetical protein SAMN04490185_3178 [Pseudomonas frederiksbergensis]